MGYDPKRPLDVSWVRQALEEYARALKPWAEKAAEVMVTEVAARNEAAWKATAREMGSLLRREISSAPIGSVLRQRMSEQVRLITSIPREAAERVHGLAMEGLETGVRAERIAEQILETGDVSKARASLIARTEVGRASSELTEARAKFAGSEEYKWRTAGDKDVRDSHRAMEGKIVRWDSPPVLDGIKGHAGAVPNCRCWAEPILPD